MPNEKVMPWEKYSDQPVAQMPWEKYASLEPDPARSDREDDPMAADNPDPVNTSAAVPETMMGQFLQQRYNPTDEGAAESEAINKNLGPDTVSKVNAIHDEYDRAIQFAQESRPENVAKLEAERDEKIKQAGLMPIDALGSDAGPVIAPSTPEDVAEVTHSFGMKGLSPSGRTAKIVSGGVNAAGGVANSLITPEGALMLASPAANAAFIAQMAASVPGSLSRAAGAYSGGDTDAGDAELINGLVTAGMIAVPAALHGKIKPKLDEIVGLDKANELRQQAVQAKPPVIQGEPSPAVEAPVQKVSEPPLPDATQEDLAHIQPNGSENWQVTVQAPQAHEKGTVPGYVQIDEVQGNQNTWSRSPDTLAKEGVNVPDFSKLPQGKYSYDEAVKLASRSESFLEPEDQAHFDAEIGKQDVPVKAVDATNEGDPFAKRDAGAIATIDRANKSIIVNKANMKVWLDGIPKEKRQMAIRSLLSEERIHLATDDGGAKTFWNNLSKPEQAIVQRRYGNAPGMNDTLWGHEAVRFRLQQLARMTPREIAEAAGREGWTLKGLTILETIVRGIRKISSFGKSRESKAILNRIQQRIDQGKAVLGSGEPSAISKEARNYALKVSEEMEAEANLVEKSGDKDGAEEMRAMAAELKQKTFDDSFREPAARRKESPNQLSLESMLSGDKFAKMRAAISGTENGEALLVKARRALFKLVQDESGQKPTSEPRARLKKRDESKGQDDFLLPGMESKRLPGTVTAASIKPGQEGAELPAVPEADRKTAEGIGAIPRLNANQLQEKAASWISSALEKTVGDIAAGKHSSFKFIEFSDYMKRNISGLQDGHVRELWQDAIAKKLSKASDDEIRALVDAVLVPKAGKIADAEHTPGELGGIMGGGRGEGKSGSIWSAMARKALSVGKKTDDERSLDQKEIEKLLLGDPNKKLSPEDVENQNEAIKQFKLNRAAADRQVARDESAANRRRSILVSNIYRKLVDVTGDRAPVDRKITVDDIRYGGGDTTAAVQDIATGSESNISALTRELLDNSKRNSEDPTTYTKRLTLLRDKQSGKVHLVSTYRRGEDAMLLDPTHPQQHHLPLKDIVRRYQVVQSILLDEPVQKFKKTWSSLKDYQDDFGAEARRINENHTSGSGSVEEPSQYINGQRITQATGESEGIPGSGVEEGAGGHIQGPFKAEYVEGGSTSMEQALRKPITSTESEAVFKHVHDMLGKSPETPDEVRRVIDEMAVKRPDRIVTVAMRKIARDLQRQYPNEPIGDLLNRMSQRIYENEVGPINRRAAVQEAASPGKNAETQDAEAGSEVSGSSGGRTEYVAPRAFNKKAVSDWVDSHEIIRNGADAIAKRRIQLKSALTRRESKREIKASADGVDNATALIGEGARNSLELVSNLAKSKYEKEMVNSSPMVMLATGKIGENKATGHKFFYYDKAVLEQQIRQFALAEIKAENMLKDPKSTRLEKRTARQWKEAAEKMQKIALFTRAHWDDPVLREMAYRSRMELHDNLQRMSAGGVDVTDFGPSYFPGRYDGENFTMDGITFGSDQMLGRLGYNKKQFKNYGEALAHGPYIPRSFSGPDIISHSVRNGMKAVNRNAWGEMMKDMKDTHSGLAVARDAVPSNPREMIDVATGKKEMNPGGWSEPSPEYKLVKITGTDKPIAVLKPYAGIVEAAMGNSLFENHPLAEGAVYFSSMLKHGIVLIWDTFHPSRLLQYAASMTPFTEHGKAALKGKSAFNTRGATSALFYRPEDLPIAVSQGKISPQSAAWAMEKILVKWKGGDKLMTKQEVIHDMVKRGLNASRIGDALYKDAVEKIPGIGKYLYHGFDEGGFNKGPSTLRSVNLKNFNGWMFDNFLPGLISESAVRNFERFHKKYPDVDADKLMRDVISDTNKFYGNMGRQGFFSHPTFRDVAQVFLLAPMWQEGLLAKEMTAYSRMTGVSNLMGRRGLPQLGALGEGVARGLAAYFVMTQVANVITTGHTTFQNEEGHQLDAWIPTGHGSGVWISPMSVFAELTHDVIRMGETKANTWGAITQIGMNKLGPMGRFFYTLASGKNAYGQKQMTTADVLTSAAGELAPVPISFGKPVQAIASYLSGGRIPPTEPGAVQRQAAAMVGVKAQAEQNSISKMSQLARKFVEDNNIRPGQAIPELTDEPSYAMMRHQLVIGDQRGAQDTLNKLIESHKGNITQVGNAMAAWARRPFTGAQESEWQFIAQLSDKQREQYTQAQQARFDLLRDFYHLSFEAASKK